MDNSASPDSLNSLNLDRTLAVAGSAAASFARLWQALWVQPYVAPPLLEMCRLTLARLHRDELELAAANPHLEPGALPAARRATVIAGKAHAAADFSITEKSVLQFAECYGLDAQSIPDDTADAVKSQLGEAGLVLLIEALGCIDGRIRSARCLRDLQRLARAVGSHEH
jgi:hypothetical protein